MTLLRRLKNLWLLSAYLPLGIRESGNSGDVISSIINLHKDFPTIQKKLATIIKEDQKDIFENERTDTE